MTGYQKPLTCSRANQSWDRAVVLPFMSECGAGREARCMVHKIALHVCKSGWGECMGGACTWWLHMSSSRSNVCVITVATMDLLLLCFQAE
jgi:hypothetical protein